MNNFDPTKPVQTRSGVPARIIATRKRPDFPIVAIVEHEDRDIVLTYTLDGRQFKDEDRPADLINVPEKRVWERWVNVYKGYTQVFPTRESADRAAHTGRIDCVHVKREFAVGEGLE